MLTELGHFIDPCGISLLHIFIQNMYSFKPIPYFEFVSFSLTSDSQHDRLESGWGQTLLGKEPPLGKKFSESLGLFKTTHIPWRL